MKQKSAPIFLLLAVAFAFASTCMAQTEASNDVNPRTIAQTSEASDIGSTQVGSVNHKTLAKSLNRKANLFGAERTSTVDPEPAPQDPDPNDWEIRFAPYLWIAGITGRTGIGNVTVDVDSGITSDNVNLNFGFMGTFEAKKNRFLILTDLQYSNLGTERPNPGPLFSGATADFKTFILAPQVGYVLAENSEKGHHLEVLGGVRIWRLQVDVNLLPGILAARSASDSRAWVDAIGGLGGRIGLTKRMFLLGKADIGGGGSKFSYQLFGGFGLRVLPKFALVGGYRSLSVNYDKDNFLFDTTLSGPVLGAVWRIK